MSSTRQRTKPIGVVAIAMALMIAFSGVAAASEPTPENEIGYVQATSMAQGAEDTTLEESDETNNCDEAEEGTKIGVRNPAAVYCMEMGYEYKIEKTNKGERGICVMPNNEECDAWAFYSGECGAEFSYCAKKGWLVASRGEKDSFATKSTTCVLPDGSCKTVSELFNLGETCTVGMKKLDENKRLSGTELNKKDIEGEKVRLPNHFDWRNKDGENWMTPVRNQGRCGSCWAFSAVGIVEPVYNIAYGNPNLDLDLSEQYLVSDCHTTPWGYQSCCGGWKDIALKYIRDYGITDEACFPYVDATGCTCSDDDICDTNCNYCDTTSPCSDATCSDRCSDWSSRLKKIDETGNVPNNKEAIKDNLIEKGPLAVSMGIGSEVGGNFVNGIYRCDDDSKTNHAVVIAGYDEREDYWIVRNSWGSSWNGDGYFKVGYGECSIENYVDYVWCRGGGDDNPDLEITDIWHEGGKIYYKIKNIGTEKAGSSRTSLTVDGAFKKYDSARSLGPGAERTESFRYKWACTNPSYEIKVCADYKNAVAESNEGNNCKTETWECDGGNGDKPDLVITDIWHEGSKIYYKIKNIGTEKAGSSRTSLTVDGAFKKYDSARSLGPGAERTESFRYKWACTNPSYEIKVCADYKNAVAESNEGNNCKTETWECDGGNGDKPDLVITDIWHEGSKIYYKIKNIGTEKAGSSRTSLTVDGAFKKYDSARSLGPGAERTESFRYKWACTNPSYEIKVCADYKNAVAESNEGNNCKTETWECDGGNGDKPDLVITDIWHEGSKIYYKIKNIGTEKAGSSRTSLTVDGVYKKYDSVRSLGAGEERTESFRYGWTCMGTSDEIKVCADYKNAVAESEEGNNCKTETWACDGGVEYWAVIAGEGYTCDWADNDAYDMYDGLLSYSNWKAENIRLLVSNAAGTKHDCTRDNIQAEIAWMASQADADDVCLFFYAGHGAHNTDIAPIDEADGWDEYICPEGGNIRDDELDAWMTTPIKGKKVVIIDSCFSGGFVKGEGARTIPGVPYAELTDGFVRDLNKPGYVTLTAADDDEWAYGSGDLNNGVFTYYVVKGLGGPANTDGDNDISAEETYDYANPKVVSYTGNIQHPQIYDGVTGELPVVKW